MDRRRGAFSADDSAKRIQNNVLDIYFCKNNGKEGENGAPTGTRTRDPMIKSHLLYQLSYGRICDGLSLGMRLIYTGSWKMQMTFAKKSDFFVSCGFQNAETDEKRFIDNIGYRLSKKYGRGFCRYGIYGRSSGIRTHDFLVPNQTRYRAALCSVSCLQYIRWSRKIKCRNNFFDEMLLKGLYS